MLNYFTSPHQKAIPIIPVIESQFSEWLLQQSQIIQNWLKNTDFKASSNTFSLVPNASGEIECVILGLKSAEDFWAFGALSSNLPSGIYELKTLTTLENLQNYFIAWGLGCYKFDRYKKSKKIFPQLVLPENINSNEIENILTSIFWVRDLINIPTEDMGPKELFESAKQLEKFNARVKEIVGDELLNQNYPAIHVVGRASAQAPRLIDIRWGEQNAFKLTLVGKGVCFDTGGLDIKIGPSMLLMKKDMAGGAHALGLARMIMQANLPINLHVLIPAVENSISANAYRPGDVIKTRKGMTVEINNTDAEGRLVVCDALTEAVNDRPDLLIDFTTLTGAARVAVGTDISAMFSNSDLVAEKVLEISEAEQDPICRLPLYTPYRKLLNSTIADISNNTSSSYAGAITAALFLKEFVPDEIPWIHLDFMAWNLSSQPGKPEGGEAMSLRAIFTYLKSCI